MRVQLLMAMGVLGGACGTGTHATNDAPGGVDASKLDSRISDATDGSNPDAPRAYAIARSGSRLKLSWYQTGDGVRTPVDGGFFDSMFSVSCRPTPWTDSNVRCTPQTTSAQAVYAYSDASCTTPVFENGAAFPANTYFADYTQPPALCGGVLVDHVYVPGSEVTLTTAYTMSGNTCVVDSGPNQHFFARVEIPASSFVEISSNYDSTGSVEQMHWDSVDGMAWFRPSGHDTVLNAACNYQLEYDGTGFGAICDPRGLSNGWSDSTCTLPLIGESGGCQPPPYVTAATVCSYANDHRVFSVGTAISPTTVYTGVHASCSPNTPNAQSVYYGASSVAGTVQTMTRDRDTSATTRLQPIYFDTTGGVHYQTNVFYDTTLATECAVGTNGLCMPTPSRTTKVLYTDAGCTMPFDAVQIDDDPATYCSTSRLSPVPDFAVKVLGVGQLEYHRVAAQHVATVYESTGTCRRYPEIGIPQNWRIFEISPTVTPTSSFETATVVTDP